MAVYERSTRIRASFEDVWAFHESVAGVVAVTPDWFRLRVESVVGPDGTPDPDVLEVGAEVTLSIQPFGLGRRQRWTSRITAREREDGHGYFRDEMRAGPFRRWRHTHRFSAVPGGTRLTDHVEYALPLGPARGLSGFAWPGFEFVFAARQRLTKQHLE